MVKTLPSNAGGAVSIPGWGAKTPRALQPKNQNINQKQYYKKNLIIYIKKMFLKNPACGMFMQWNTNNKKEVLLLAKNENNTDVIV